MGIITTMRRQKAVYWAAGVPDRHGERAMATAVEIDCRWEDVAEEFTDANGATRISRAKVNPDRVCTLGGFLWEGELTNVPNADPHEVEKAYEVVRFDKLPNLRNTEILYTAWL